MGSALGAAIADFRIFWWRRTCSAVLVRVRSSNRVRKHQSTGLGQTADSHHIIPHAKLGPKYAFRVKNVQKREYTEGREFKLRHSRIVLTADLPQPNPTCGNKAARLSARSRQVAARNRPFAQAKLRSLADGPSATVSATKCHGSVITGQAGSNSIQPLDFRNSAFRFQESPRYSFLWSFLEVKCSILLQISGGWFDTDLRWLVLNRPVTNKTTISR